MRVNGSHTLHAPPGRVWATLTNPAVLSRSILGCESLELTPPGGARLTVTAAVASTTATYAVQISTSDRHPPDSLTLTVEAKGEPGSLTGSVRVRLAPDDGNTQFTYEASAEPTGQLAAVGQALLSATAARLASQCVEALDDALTHRPEQTPTAEPGRRLGGAAGVASPPPAKTPRASGTTVEPPPVARQPAVPLGAIPPAVPLGAPPPAVPLGASPPAVPLGATPQAVPERAAAQGATMLGRSVPGKGFAPGVLVGAAVGVAAAKLAGLLARRNR